MISGLKRSTFTLVYWLPIGVILALMVGGTNPANGATLNYQQIIEAALANDPLLKAHRKKQQSWQHQAHAANQWADPTLSVAMANLPVNGFDIHQEAMSQFKFGISQKLPQGDSLAIQAKQHLLKADMSQWQVKTRFRQLQRDVGNHWLSLHLAYMIRGNIVSSQTLLTELQQTSEARYAAGSRRLDDVIIVEIMQTRLALKLTELDGAILRLNAELSQWLGEQWAVETRQFDGRLPPLNIPPEVLSWSRADANLAINRHPQLQLSGLKVSLADQQTDLLKQQYQPLYSVNAAYGFRADDMLGRSRADLFSIGLNVQLPLFSSARQDAQVKAAIVDSASIGLQKESLLQQMNTDFFTLKAELHQLKQQLAVYQDQLLNQLSEHIEVTVNAYTANQGKFDEVIKAHMAQLEGLNGVAQIQISLLQKVNQMNYLVSRADDFSGLGVVDGGVSDE